MTNNVIAYIGLGSNLENPLAQLEAALQNLHAQQDIELIACSAFYASSPLGPTNQPDYTNAVAKISTRLSPQQLLQQCQHIEDTQGRQRDTERWGARTLDLDILTFGEHIINQANLIIPHPGMTERGFVLHPLLELTGHINIQGLGSIQQLIDKLSDAKPRLIVSQ